MMTKQDYELLAKAIGIGIALDNVIGELCEALILNNPKFDEEKFIKKIYEYMEHQKGVW
jgi:hypothetical protein